jgi:hypothetical protein
MDMITILTSQKLKAAGYDVSTATLRAQMLSGEVYEYSGVAPKRWERLMSGQI